MTSARSRAEVNFCGIRPWWRCPLMEWFGRAPASKPGFYFPTAAPTVVRDLVVVGGLVRDNAETGSGSSRPVFHREAFHALSPGREARLRRPDRPPGLFRCLRSISFVTPKTRARDALAAMEKCLFNVNDHREIGYSAIICHRAPDILIPDNDGTTGNAKRFALTRNKEDQAGRPDSAARCERYRRGGCHDDPEWQGSLRQDRLQIPRDLPLVTDQPGQTDRLN